MSAGSLGRPVRSGWVGVACLLALLPASGLRGQEPRASPTTGVVRGVVVDDGTGTPLEGARVRLEGERRGVLADSLGAFEIRGAPLGFNFLSVDHYGFVGMVVPVDVTAGPQVPVELRLPASPLVVEGITVAAEHVATMEQRLRSRRRAVPYAVRAFDLERLTRSAATTMVEFLQFEGSMFTVPCPARTLANSCIVRRGRVQEPVVYIDEVRAFGSLDQLATYSPHELYLVEVYSMGSEIRAYTHNFMHRMARRPMALIPIGLWGR